MPNDPTIGRAPYQNGDERAENLTATPIAYFPTEELPPIQAVYERYCGPITAEPDADGEVDVVCPLHNDSTPSLHLNLRTNVFKCFVCEKGGGVLEFVMYSENFTRSEQAARWLREKRLMLARSRDAWSGPNVTIYEYVDAHGLVLYQVGRKQISDTKKTFLQRSPKPDGSGWLPNIDGVLRVPYRLPEVKAAAESGGTIYVVEGEKDADNLRAALIGSGTRRDTFAVTTNSGGSGWRWPGAWADHVRGAARVVVLADNDEPGLKAARHRASICALSVPDTRLVGALPGLAAKGDVTDWLTAGHTIGELNALVDGAPVAEPYSENYPRHAVQDLLENLTDTGNAHWFVACEGDRTRFVYDENVWRTWDGQRWTDATDRNAQTAAARAGVALRAAVGDLNQAERDALEAHAKALGNMGPRKNMIEAATAIPELQLFSNQLDQHAMKLNLQNGVLDCETFELSPHDRGLLFTEVMPFAYDPTADCPNFKNWLSDAMEHDEERVEYVQRIMGSMLVAKPGRRQFYYAYGPAGTGKSTITQVMMELMGEFAWAVDFASISLRDKLSGGAPRPDLVVLRGKRLITAVESRANDRLDPACLKHFVGGDALSVRNMYKGQITFKIQAVIFLSGNEKPMIDAGEDFWTKIKVIPFKHVFPRQDVNFFDRVLRPELPGVLTFCVEGLKKLVADDWQLRDPAAVIAETAEYRDSENKLGQFFEEVCEFGADFRMEPTPIYDAYAKWYPLRHGGNSRQMLGDRSFWAKLLQDPRVTRTPVSHGKRRYCGIRVRQDVLNAIDSGMFGRSSRPTTAPTEEDQF